MPCLNSAFRAQALTTSSRIPFLSTHYGLHGSGTGIWLRLLSQKFWLLNKLRKSNVNLFKMDDDDKIQRMQKVWNAPWAMRELGWV
jgi:hypothetical protein